MNKQTLIENTAIAKEPCRWCDADHTPHSAACPLGDRYQQVQKIGGVRFVLPVGQTLAAFFAQ